MLIPVLHSFNQIRTLSKMNISSVHMNFITPDSTGPDDNVLDWLMTATEEEVVNTFTQDRL